MYEELYGGLPPPFAKLPPGQVGYLEIRWERDRRDYLVGFGHQHVVNGNRDFFGNPIPYKSGLTTFTFFRVRENDDCQYSGIIEGGEY